MSDDFVLKTLEEDCLNIISNPDICLDTEVTGVHYLLSSKLHATKFYRLSKAFEYGPKRERLARLSLNRIKAAGFRLDEIDALVGPAMGAVPLMYTLQHFSELEHVRVMYTERGDNEEYILNRGFSLDQDMRILIIDDVVSTFRTIRKTIQALHDACGKQTGWEAMVIGIAALIDRTPADREPLEWFAPTLKFVSGLRIPEEAYTPEKCDPCKKGIPLVKP